MFAYKLFVPDVESRPWDFQAEECLLRSAVDRFNHRRYGRPTTAATNAAVAAANNAAADNNVQSQLGFTGDKIVSLFTCKINLKALIKPK